jgi:hypothetical protein
MAMLRRLSETTEPQRSFNFLQSSEGRGGGVRTGYTPAMTVTDAETGCARPARSPDTKAAVPYLAVSDATAIIITEHHGVCSFHVAHKIDPRAL